MKFHHFCFPLRKIFAVNLIIEQGNTLTKVAVYEDGCMLSSSMHKHLDTVFLDSLFKIYPLKRGIMSTVIDTDEEMVAYLRSRLESFIILDETVSLPIEIGYETPSTLGKDRLAAVMGAYDQRPGQDILIIDAGTAITYELLESSGKYLGGNISPGMTTRFRALHQFTKKLPLLSEDEEIPFIGTSTEKAIQAGVVNGIVYEMDGYIDALKVKYSDLFVFLTGGHSFYFERRLKNSIFVDINLVFGGLNRILEYNVEN